MLCAASLSGARRRQRSARLPDLQQWPAVAKAVEIRRLHRLLELSGMPLYPAALGLGRRRTPISAPRSSASIPKPASMSPCAAAASAPICSSAKARKAKSRSAPACRRTSAPDAMRSRTRAPAPVAAARSRQASRGRRADQGRHRPLRALRAARQDLRQSRDARDDIFTIGLNRAVTLIAEKIAKGPRNGRFGADPGRPLGDHPAKGGANRGQEGPLRPLCQP